MEFQCLTEKEYNLSGTGTWCRFVTIGSSVNNDTRIPNVKGQASMFDTSSIVLESLIATSKQSAAIALRLTAYKSIQVLD